MLVTAFYRQLVRMRHQRQHFREIIKITSQKEGLGDVPKGDAYTDLQALDIQEPVDNIARC